MTKREHRFFNLAKATALCSPHKKFNIGAVIINHNKQILSIAYNQTKSHPEQKKLNKYRYTPYDKDKNFLHAELAAILKANKEELKNAIIYVYRQDLNGHIACSRPCPACMAKIKEVGIRVIYYTTRDGFCKEQLY